MNYLEQNAIKRRKKWKSPPLHVIAFRQLCLPLFVIKFQVIWSMMLIELTTLQKHWFWWFDKNTWKTFMYRDCPKDNEMVKKNLVLRTFGDSRMILKLTKHNKK